MRVDHDISKKINPFSHFRTENMGSEIWRYYVPGPFERLLTPRPLILEGGRGSGKTMFFICNSWREQLSLLKNDGKDARSLLSDKSFIGLYYKVDSAFTKGMSERRPDWSGIFNTYLGICILTEILEVIQIFIDEKIIQEEQLSNILSKFNKLVPETVDIKTIKQTASLFEKVLDGVEEVVNDPSAKLSFKGTVTGRLVKDFITDLRALEPFKNICVRIFIDEYEMLLEYQQRIVNLLIKNTTHFLIYNVGMRPKGMLTSGTPNQGDIIQAPHDYTHFLIENMYSSDEDDSESTYYQLLTEICEKRLKRVCIESGLDIPTDIRFYLGDYDANEEIRAIISSRDSAPFLKQLRDRIDSLENDKRKADYYFGILGSEANPANARLHLCLLYRTPRYRPQLDDLVKEYQNWLEGKETLNYREWYQHNKMGLIYLLAKEYGQQKQYYGFKTYAMLSTGVIRYFLELCEQAFEFAFTNNFSWENPKQIDPGTQTRAAFYVSSYKFNDIDGYEPNSRQLKIFTQNLGDLFNILHTHSNLALSEPEPNHFATNDESLDYESMQVLNSALMWGVLQQRPATKEKASELPIELKDYHLNHIYTPYFGISYRKKHKLFLLPKELQILLSGNNESARQILLKYHSKADSRKRIDSVQLSLIDSEDKNYDDK